MNLEFGLYLTLIGVVGVFTSLGIIAAVCIALKRLFKRREPEGAASHIAVAAHEPEEKQVVASADSGTFKIRIDGEEHSVRVREMGTEKDPGELALPTDLGSEFTVAVDGEEHAVKVEGRPVGLLRTPSKKVVPRPAEPTPSAKHTIKAPMRGTVVRIYVKTGDRIEKGKTLLVLETMKMENAIESPSSGVVRTVQVSEGEAVDADAILVTVD